MTIINLILNGNGICPVCGGQRNEINEYAAGAVRMLTVSCLRCKYEWLVDGMGENAPSFRDIAKKIHPDVCHHPKATALTQKLMNFKNNPSAFLVVHEKEFVEVVTDGAELKINRKEVKKFKVELNNTQKFIRELAQSGGRTMKEIEGMAWNVSGDSFYNAFKKLVANGFAKRLNDGRMILC